MATVGTDRAGVDYILILRRRLRLYLDICMAHSLLIRRWSVSSASSSWCELWAWIGWAAVDTEFWLVTVVVIPPPMVHRDHWQDVVMMWVSHAGAALRALSGMAAPHSYADDRNDEHDQQQWHDQVERVDSSYHRLQPSRWTALPHIFVPESFLQPIRRQMPIYIMIRLCYIHARYIVSTWWQQNVPKTQGHRTHHGLHCMNTFIWISSTQRQRTITPEQKATTWLFTSICATLLSGLSQ